MDVSRIISFLVVLVVKNLPANTGDTGDSGSIPGLGRTSGIPANLFPQSYSNFKRSYYSRHTIHDVAF